MSPCFSRDFPTFDDIEPIAVSVDEVVLGLIWQLFRPKNYRFFELGRILQWSILVNRFHFEGLTSASLHLRAIFFQLNFQNPINSQAFLGSKLGRAI